MRIRNANNTRRRSSTEIVSSGSGANRADASIAVVGSCNLDVVSYVISLPEAGETVRANRMVEYVGGKGVNQAVAAARSGARVTMVGAVGSDETAQQVRSTLVSSGVDISMLRTGTQATGTAYITVDGGGHNTIVYHAGANAEVTELTDDELAVISKCTMVLLQMELPTNVAISASAVAQEVGAQVLLTPAPVCELPGNLLRNVDLLVPNAQEAQQLTGESSPERSLSVLLERVPAAVITLGASGSLYRDRHHELIHVPTPAVDAVDTTGAGDTFVGSLSAALARGWLFEKALSWASAAAALSVRHMGGANSIPKFAEIASFVESWESRVDL